jgi:hypothetical protein
MRRDLQRHPKVVRMASALNADRLRVIGGLHAVWSVFDEHSEDGLLDGYSLDAMDDAIGWPGFAQAMNDVAWLEEVEPQVLAVPEFSEHNGQSGKRRASETKRKRKEREADKQAHDGGEMSASDADEKRARRRKEKKNSSSLRSEEGARSRFACPARPDGVTEQTWSDWLQLRKGHKAAVTETVMAEAVREAAKDGLELLRFLEIWCLRGSRGLQAEWLRADERRASTPATSGKHAGFAEKNYREGIEADGSFN